MKEEEEEEEEEKERMVEVKEGVLNSLIVIFHLVMRRQ
jgi:hypothetical protein